MEDKKKLVIYRFHFSDCSVNQSFTLEFKSFGDSAKFVDIKTNLVERFEKFFDCENSSDIQYLTYQGVTKEVKYY